MRKFSAITFGLILFSLPLAAEGMRTLEQVVAGDYEPSYPMVRCASFYMANIAWSGTAAIGDEAVAQSRLAVTDLSLVAAIVRQRRSGGPMEQIVQNIDRDLSMIMDLYLANYQQNYASTGAAWDGNPLWQSDAVSCKYVAEVAGKLSNQIRGGGDQ